MKKYLFMLAALVMGLAACTTDPTPDGPKTDGDGNQTEVGATQLTRMNVQSGRILETDEEKDVWLKPPTYSGDNAKDVFFSATSLDFSADGKYVYISWHSNRAQDLDEDSEEHDHGTNVVDDSEPSLDADKTWGGILDVISLDGTTPTCVALYSQPEHKYNYVKLYNDNLYLASTSWFVGAALHVVPVENNLPKVDGAYRVNLDGNSANCVEVVGDNKVLAVSGRTVGGLQLFTPGDKDADANKVAAQNFGGKFAYATEDAVFVLYETKEDGEYIPYVRVYSKTDFTQTDEFKVESAANDEGETEVYKLTPIDGKNVLKVYDGKVYVCCGQYGLHVFEKKDGAYVEVGNSHKNTAENINANLSNQYYAANGVDVDDKNIYIANGAGLVILDKTATRQNKFGGYAVKKNKQFDETASWITNGNDKTAEGVVKESSNFVVVKNNKAYVAYGMYGLRIYDISAYTADAEPEEVPAE